MAKPQSITSPQAQSFLKKIKSKAKLGESARIAYYSASTKITGDLALGDKEAILVDGDLDVKGHVFDVGVRNEDDYGYLVVRGQLSCGALIWGGSVLAATKGITARKFVYFNGWGLQSLEAGPRLATPILMSEDNEIIAKKIDAGRVFVRDPSTWVR